MKVLKVSFRTLFFFLAFLQSTGCHAQSVIKATTDPAKSFIIPDRFNGFNTQMMRGPAWRDAGFIEQVQKLEPALIRYPGGTVASHWDWKTGWLMEGIPLKADWSKIPKNPLTIEDLKFACDATGAVPVLVLNMMHSTLEYQLEFLRKVKQTGLPVKYVELDNEIYLGEEFYVKKYPTGKEYAAEANTWIAAIKNEFAGVKIGVVGCADKEIQNVNKKKYEGRTNTWNRDVISVIKGADAMTFHVYGGTGLSAVHKASGGGAAENEKEKSVAYQTAFEKPGSEELLLGIPYARWKTTVTYDYPILPPGMKVWATEYNLFEKEGVVAGTWAHGLYALAQTLLFMEDQRTELICYHNLTTSAQFAAIFNNEQGFDKSVRKKPTTKFDLTASGHTLSMFGKAVKGGNKATALKFTGVSNMKGLRGQPYSALSGWYIEGSGKKAIVMNLSGQAISIDLSNYFGAGASWSQEHAGIRTQVAGAADVKTTTGKGSSVRMEPYGVMLITAD
jgi:hypothetical protein